METKYPAEFVASDGVKTFTGTLEYPGASPVVVRGPFSFAYNTPGLATGLDFYTPAVGDILLDAWFEVDAAWNGLGNLGDFGTFSGPTGLIHQLASTSGVDLTMADVAATDNNGLLLSGATKNSLGCAIVGQHWEVAVTAARPLMVVVSQDGQLGDTPAFKVADAAPTSPLIVLAGINDEFVFTGSLGTGVPETFTVAPGNYATLVACIAAMAAATGSVSGERFDTLVTPSDSGAGTILLTMVSGGGNGNTITLGANDVAAGLGFTANPDTFAGGVGGATGGSTGAARLYVVTATPLAF